MTKNQKDTFMIDKVVLDGVYDAIRRYRKSFGKKSLLYEGSTLAYLIRRGDLEPEIFKRKIDEYREKGMSEQDIQTLYLMAGIE